MRSASIGYLRNPRDALAPPDQPPHAGEVENADPQAVPESVVRATVKTRTGDHVNVSHLVSVAPDERRQKTMHAVEKGERQEGLAPERLAAAARIAGSVAQDRAAHGVGDARLHPFESGVAAADPLARHQPHAGTPVSSARTIAGMNEGSFWQSPSKVTMSGARAAATPVRTAAALPHVAA